MASKFKFLKSVAGDRIIEVHCDKDAHVQLTLPANRYSGEQTEIDISPCDCKKPAAPKAAA